MYSMTDFELWLAEACVESRNEYDNVLAAIVSPGEMHGGFLAVEQGEQVHISRKNCDCSLRLASMWAKNAFLRLLEYRIDYEI